MKPTLQEETELAQADRTAALRREYAAIVLRSGAPREGDAARLAELVAALDISDEELRADLGMLARRTQLASEAAKLDAAKRAYSVGTEEVDALAEEAGRLGDKLCEKRWTLQNELFQAMSNAQAAAAEIQVLETRIRARLEGVPIGE